MIHSDFAWLNEHSSELFERYRGKWIAVLDGRVIGIGDKATEAGEQAKSAAQNRLFVLEAVVHELEVISVC